MRLWMAVFFLGCHNTLRLGVPLLCLRGSANEYADLLRDCSYVNITNGLHIGRLVIPPRPRSSSFFLSRSRQLEPQQTNCHQYERTNSGRGHYTLQRSSGLALPKPHLLCGFSQPWTA